MLACARTIRPRRIQARQLHDGFTCHESVAFATDILQPYHIYAANPRCIYYSPDSPVEEFTQGGELPFPFSGVVNC